MRNSNTQGSGGTTATLEMVKPKNIKVPEDLYKELAKEGKFSESYADIIRRLLDFYRKHKHLEDGRRRSDSGSTTSN